MLVAMLESGPPEQNHRAEPRASLILPAGEHGSIADIWMGGAHTAHGDEITVDRLRDAWLIDTAGDMPPDLRRSAVRTLTCVFVDSEGTPSPFWRVQDTVADAVAAARGELSTSLAGIYVVCTHGMNRSGLVTGMILRGLGLSGAEAVQRIRSGRPGALSNRSFEAILRDGRPAD